jgi:hypothetical protein
MVSPNPIHCRFPSSALFIPSPHLLHPRKRSLSHLLTKLRLIRQLLQAISNHHGDANRHAELTYPSVIRSESLFLVEAIRGQPREPRPKV